MGIELFFLAKSLRISKVHFCQEALKTFQGKDLKEIQLLLESKPPIVRIQWIWGFQETSLAKVWIIQILP